MHADFQSEVEHLTLNKFRVTMDTAHATSAVLFCACRLCVIYLFFKTALILGESACSGHNPEMPKRPINFSSQII